jgi:hypothetical protein
MGKLRTFGALTLAAALGALVLAAPVAADPTTAWTAGPGASGDDTYDGYIDLPGAGSTVPSGDSTLVGGWIVNTQAQGWAGIDQLQVYQGAMGSGGTMLASGIVAQSRPDVGTALGNPYWANSGFSATIPSGALKPGQVTINVYAHTPSNGWWYKQRSFNVSSGSAPSAPTPSTGGGGGATGETAQPTTQSVPGGLGATFGSLVVGVEAPKSGEQVHTDRDYTIMGYALDKNASLGQGAQNSGISEVQVFMDGPKTGTDLGKAMLAYSSDDAATFGSQFANSGFRLTFHPTQFSTASHNLWVYATSAVTGNRVVTLIPINITDTPTNPTS